IAPFWDDLMFYLGPSVTVRTFGTAPNRQLVVEWAHASIKDDSGKDQFADLTFEAILYEGSNDIQFVYGGLSGPLSDGSSATVGMQNLGRTAAVLTGFNQPVVKSTSVITYSFQNGSYVTTAAVADITPPGKPVVTDEGPATGNAAQLAASWTSSAPPSGISAFQYA